MELCHVCDEICKDRCPLRFELDQEMSALGRKVRVSSPCEHIRFGAGVDRLVTKYNKWNRKRRYRALTCDEVRLCEELLSEIRRMKKAITRFRYPE